MDRGRIWLPIFVAVVFSMGIATGVLLSQFVQSTRTAAEAPLMRPMPRDLTDKLAVELHLTGEQRAELDAIVTARRRMFAEMRDDARQRFQNDVTRMTADIQKILTPHQRKQFDAFIVRVRTRYLDDEVPREP